MDGMIEKLISSRIGSAAASTASDKVWRSTAYKTCTKVVVIKELSINQIFTLFTLLYRENNALNIKYSLNSCSQVLRPRLLFTHSNFSHVDGTWTVFPLIEQ